VITGAELLQERILLQRWRILVQLLSGVAANQLALAVQGVAVSLRELQVVNVRAEVNLVTFQSCLSHDYISYISIVLKT
jgi:hypothetical protein